MSGKPVIVRRAETAMYDYLKRTVVDGETPELCDPDAALTMAGMVQWAIEHQYQCEGGMSPEQAHEACARWITEMAALSASLAETE